MSVAIAVTLAVATLAFGAVYPWAYVPLFLAAILFGLAGLIRRRQIVPGARMIAIVLSIVIAAACFQLVPVSKQKLDELSPHTAELLRVENLAFVTVSTTHPLSIEPASTLIAVGALIAFGIYLVGAPAAFSGADLRALPRYLTLFAVPLSLFGVLTRERGNNLIYWFWKPIDGGAENAFGPFVNRNHFAGWMLMATALSLGDLLGRFESAGRWRRAETRNWIAWSASQEANEIALTTVAVTTMIVSLIWTLSRSAMVGFACVIASFGFAVTRRYGAFSAKGAAALSVLGGLLLVGIGWRGGDRLFRWFRDTTDLQTRFAAWGDGWRLFRDFPIFGTGLNTYGSAMLLYQRSNAGTHLGSAHNDYLQLLAEGGILLTVPALLLILVLMVAIYQNIATVAGVESRGYWIRTGAAIGLIGIAVQESAEFSLQIPVNAFLFCTLAAMTLTPVRSSPPR